VRPAHTPPATPRRRVRGQRHRSIWPGTARPVKEVLAGQAGSGMAKTVSGGRRSVPSRHLPEAYPEPPHPARARYARPTADPCRAGRTRVRAGPRRRDGEAAGLWLRPRSFGPNPAQPRATSSGKRCQTLEDLALVRVSIGPVAGDIQDRRGLGLQVPAFSSLEMTVPRATSPMKNETSTRKRPSSGRLCGISPGWNGSQPGRPAGCRLLSQETVSIR